MVASGMSVKEVASFRGIQLRIVNKEQNEKLKQLLEERVFV